jgi:hypothetical protein
MSLTLPQIQVLPVVSDTSNFYLSLQPVTSGKTVAQYVSPVIYYNAANQMLTVDSKISMQVTGQLMANNILNSSIDNTVIGANVATSALFTSVGSSTVAANTSVYSNKIGIYANTSTTTSAVYQVYNPATQTIDTVFG